MLRRNLSTFILISLFLFPLLHYSSALAGIENSAISSTESATSSPQTFSAKVAGKKLKEHCISQYQVSDPSLSCEGISISDQSKRIFIVNYGIISSIYNFKKTFPTKSIKTDSQENIDFIVIPDGFKILVYYLHNFWSVEVRSNNSTPEYKFVALNSNFEPLKEPSNKYFSNPTQAITKAFKYYELPAQKYPRNGASATGLKYKFIQSELARYFSIPVNSEKHIKSDAPAVRKLLDIFYSYYLKNEPYERADISKLFQHNQKRHEQASVPASATQAPPLIQTHLTSQSNSIQTKDSCIYSGIPGCILNYGEITTDSCIQAHSESSSSTSRKLFLLPHSFKYLFYSSNDGGQSWILEVFYKGSSRYFRFTAINQSTFAPIQKVISNEDSYDINPDIAFRKALHGYNFSLTNISDTIFSQFLISEELQKLLARYFGANFNSPNNSVLPSPTKALLNDFILSKHEVIHQPPKPNNAATNPGLNLDERILSTNTNTETSKIPKRRNNSHNSNSRSLVEHCKKEYQAFDSSLSCNLVSVTGGNGRKLVIVNYGELYSLQNIKAKPESRVFRESLDAHLDYLVIPHGYKALFYHNQHFWSVEVQIVSFDIQYRFVTLNSDFKPLKPIQEHFFTTPTAAMKAAHDYYEVGKALGGNESTLAGVTNDSIQAEIAEYFHKPENAAKSEQAQNLLIREKLETFYAHYSAKRNKNNDVIHTDLEPDNSPTKETDLTTPVDSTHEKDTYSAVEIDSNPVVVADLTIDSSLATDSSNPVVTTDSPKTENVIQDVLSNSEPLKNTSIRQLLSDQCRNTFQIQDPKLTCEVITVFRNKQDIVVINYGQITSPINIQNKSPSRSFIENFTDRLDFILVPDGFKTLFYHAEHFWTMEIRIVDFQPKYRFTALDRNTFAPLIEVPTAFYDKPTSSLRAAAEHYGVGKEAISIAASVLAGITYETVQTELAKHFGNAENAERSIQSSSSLVRGQIEKFCTFYSKQIKSESEAELETSEITSAKQAIGVEEASQNSVVSTEELRTSKRTKRSVEEPSQFEATAQFTSRSSGSTLLAFQNALNASSHNSAQTLPLKLPIPAPKVFESRYVTKESYPEMGYGLKATEDIPKGTTVTLYPIDVIDYERDSKANPYFISAYANLRHDPKIDISSYYSNSDYGIGSLHENKTVFGFPLNPSTRDQYDPRFIGHLINDALILTLDLNAFVENSEEMRRENELRIFEYFNVAVEGINVQIDSKLICNNGFCFMKMYAIRDIKKHEQLFFHYGPFYWLQKQLKNLDKLLKKRTNKSQVLKEIHNFCNKAAETWISNHLQSGNSEPDWWSYPIFK